MTPVPWYRFSQRETCALPFLIFFGGKTPPSGLGDATFEAAVSWLNIRGSKIPAKQVNLCQPSQYPLQVSFTSQGWGSKTKLTAKCTFLQASMAMGKLPSFLVKYHQNCRFAMAMLAYRGDSSHKYRSNLQRNQEVLEVDFPCGCQKSI